MPYITRPDIYRLDVESPKTSGELNYKFTEIVNEYIVVNGLNYQHINDVIGALEGAKLEFYRRIVSNYEDKKMNENGDVYSDVTRGEE